MSKKRKTALTVKQKARLAFSARGISMLHVDGMSDGEQQQYASLVNEQREFVEDFPSKFDELWIARQESQKAAIDEQEAEADGEPAINE